MKLLMAQNKSYVLWGLEKLLTSFEAELPLSSTKKENDIRRHIQQIRTLYTHLKYGKLFIE